MPHAIEMDSTVERWIMRSVPKNVKFRDVFYDALDQKIQLAQPLLDSPDKCYWFGVEFATELATKWRQEGKPQEERDIALGEDLFNSEAKKTTGYFHEAQESVNRCVNDLYIADNIKRYLRGIIDNVALRFSNSGDHLTTQRDDTIVVTINVSDFYWTNSTIPNWYGEPQSEHFSRVRSLMIISHELGHAIGMAMTKDRNVFESRAPVKYGNSGMKKYPLTFHLPKGPTRADSVEHVYYDVAKNERFASYFSHAVQEGLGAPFRTVVDEALSCLLPYKMGLSMKQLQYVWNGFQDQIYFNEFPDYQDLERYGMNMLYADLYMPMYKNDGMHFLFPFSQTAVEQVIRRAWRKKVKEFSLNIS